MAANTHRGEMEVTWADGEQWLLQYAWKNVSLLEERLKCDVLAWMSEQRGSQKFLEEAILCGRIFKDKKCTPGKVRAKLGDYDKDTQDLTKEILYAVARGKPPKDAERMLEALDEAFSEAEDEELGSPSVPARAHPPSAGSDS